jgi:hypothetical protein
MDWTDGCNGYMYDMDMQGRERREGIMHLEERKYTILHTEQILQAGWWEAGIVTRKI